MKYHPSFPKTFINVADAIVFGRAFLDWCSDERQHSGIAECSPRGPRCGSAPAYCPLLRTGVAE